MNNEKQKQNKQPRNNNRKPIAKRTYPYLIKELNESHSFKKHFFGLIVDKTYMPSKEWDLGNGKIKSETEHITYRVVFGILKYMKSYYKYVHTYDKQPKSPKLAK